jgi:hypothetical protein
MPLPSFFVGYRPSAERAVACAAISDAVAKRGPNEPSGGYREVRELPSRLAEQSIEVGAVVALGSLLKLRIDVHRHR